MSVNCSLETSRGNETSIAHQLGTERALLPIISIAILLNLTSAFTFKILRRGNEAVFLLCFFLLSLSETIMCITGTLNSVFYCHLYTKYAGEPVHESTDKIVRMVITSARYYCIYCHHWWLVIITALRTASVIWPMRTRIFLTNYNVYCMFATCNFLTIGIYPAMYGINQLTRGYLRWKRLGNYLHMVLSMVLPAFFVFSLTITILILLAKQQHCSNWRNAIKSHTTSDETSAIKLQSFERHNSYSKAASNKMRNTTVQSTRFSHHQSFVAVSQKATRMLILVALSFVLFQTMAIVTWVRVTRCQAGTHTLLDEILWQISEKLVYLDSAFNFMVLVLFSAQFRVGLRKGFIVTLGRCVKISRSRQEDFHNASFRQSFTKITDINHKNLLYKTSRTSIPDSPHHVHSECIDALNSLSSSSVPNIPFQLELNEVIIPMIGLTESL